jgi:hypothetical protein
VAIVDGIHRQVQRHAEGGAGGDLFEPARIAVFADYDEYTTVFSSSPLGALRDRLTQRGVKFVEYYCDPP